MADAPLTMRELLTQARERLGPRAAGLKTRAELMAALGLAEAAPPAPAAPTAPAPPAPPALVTRDFFRRR